MKKLSLFTIVALAMFSCNSTKETTQETSRTANTQEKGRPNPETMFAEMDTNKDGKLSKDEVKGPLSEKFSEIDSNSDGYISKEELKNMPKPERGGQGGGQRR
ncbi:EF-hand domain-containing protein [Flavobacterium gelidilacus]|uniref:EF-hand domain-containing protein n=1 Tax=Flavobacterium gelidilacus TaxID=206041 RepID=UPI000406853B|nr:EF-hand domain-containing protein [Flavobacterium gelidilacus]